MAAARMTLSQLHNEGSVAPIIRDDTSCRTLLAQAERHIGTAEAGLEIGDYEGAFQLAYDACRKACLALIQSTGLRPTDDRGSHAVTFEAAAAIADGFGGRRLVDDAGRLRYVRHGAQYRADSIDPADARDAVGMARELAAGLGPAVERIVTHPPPFRPGR